MECCGLLRITEDPKCPSDVSNPCGKVISEHQKSFLAVLSIASLLNSGLCVDFIDELFNL